MTRWQLTAITNYALLAEECAHPRFGHVLAHGTLVLTVNAGYE